MSDVQPVNEVYEVCTRLKAIGFPQSICDWHCYYDADTGTVGRIAITDYPAMPSSDECMIFARTRWPRCMCGVDHYDEGEWQADITMEATDPNESVCQYEASHPTDPSQAARLCLAAALEAETRTPTPPDGTP